MKLESLQEIVADAVDDRDQMLGRPAKTCVIVPDATRPLPFKATLRPLFEGLGGGDIICLVGLGLHRPMTPAELAPIRCAADGFDVEIVQHKAHDDDLVHRGTTAHIPIDLNRHIAESDQVICVGTVEPHQYAGYSGGIKAISIGCAGPSTIAAMHGLKFLRDERTTLGRLWDNPFQLALWEIAGSIDNILGLQIVPDSAGGIADVFFGEIRSAFKKACRIASNTFFETLDTPLDWLHLPVPDLKAVNFYQASRAATYVALVDRPAIRPGGVILVEAGCPEKMGVGMGERACAQAMHRGRSALVSELFSDEKLALRGGQQRAYVLAKARQRNPIALIGAPPIDGLAAMEIEQFDSIDEASDAFGLQDQRGRRIDDVFHRIPTIS